MSPQPTMSGLASLAGLWLLWSTKVVSILLNPFTSTCHLAGVDLIPGGYYFIRSRFKRVRDPYQETPVYEVIIITKFPLQKMNLNLLLADVWEALPEDKGACWQQACSASRARLQNTINGDIEYKYEWLLLKDNLLRGIFWLIIEGFLEGHGDEYSYEDDGTWSSLCLALPSPHPNVGFLKRSFSLIKTLLTKSHIGQLINRGRFLQFSRDGRPVIPLATQLRSTGN